MLLAFTICIFEKWLQFGMVRLAKDGGGFGKERMKFTCLVWVVSTQGRVMLLSYKYIST